MLSPQIRIGVVELLNEQWDLEALMAEAGKALEQAKSLAQEQGIAIPQSMAQSVGEEKQNLSLSPLASIERSSVLWDGF